ncbi:MAG: hypothetical protein KGJ08_06910 [Gammaproteobacteria bacterium]|nr:hypothetical protein [Gammaproteobacteria bacterium]
MRNAFTALWLLHAAPALLADTLGKPAQLLISLMATVGTLHGTLELPAGPAPYPLALSSLALAPRARTAMPSRLRSQLTSLAGDYVKTGETKTAEYQGDTIILVKTLFKNGALWTQVAFDKSGKVAGLFFKPAD